MTTLSIWFTMYLMTSKKIHRHKFPKGQNVEPLTGSRVHPNGAVRVCETCGTRQVKIAGQWTEAAPVNP